MARLASEAKMGYYPTPLATLKHIVERIVATKTHCLDPCCGEGFAIHHIKRALNQVVWGIELDTERAENAQMMGVNVESGSIFDARINPLESMGLLYLNPPYSSEDGERLEMKFLRHSIKWLAPSGVLVFIVPEHVLQRQQSRDWIGQHFEGIRVYRIHKTDYPVFKQVVLYGYKRKRRVEDGEPILPPPYPYIEESPKEVYFLPETEGPTVFQIGDNITDKEIEDNATFVREKLSGIYKISKDINKKISPLLPLKNGHLIALLSSGALNGEIKDNDNHIVIKGFSTRTEIKTETDHEVIIKDTYSVGIRVIEVNRGEWYDVR